MVPQPVLTLWDQIKALKPSFLRKKPHFTFITVHCSSPDSWAFMKLQLTGCSIDFWIIGLALLASCMVYAERNIPYIDALFFASGGCTQSGLNTVDLNQLRTYQQIILFVLPQLTNPITINTFVVFLRLYWFEKRFQHIAKEAKRMRRSISKARTETRAKEDRDLGREERGVRGKTITVMHNMGTPINGHTPNGSAGKTNVGGEGNASGGSSETNGPQDDFAITFEKGDTLADRPPLKSHATIKFADQVKRSDGLEDEVMRMPQRRNNETNIAFLERQRNRNDGVLRIPGPRDADRGVAPETIVEDSLSPPTRRVNSNTDRPTDTDRPLSPSEDPTVPKESKREQLAESAHAAARALDVLGFRQARSDRTQGKEEELDDPDGIQHHPRPRMMSFQTIKRHFTRDREDMDPMPYISFQPTVGRNSAFVDLTEAQREELGGIEYRSLKSLAAVLVGYFWFWTLFSYITMVPWILRSGTYGEVVDRAGQDRIWWVFFTGTSAFNDVGFTLTPDSMISFQTAVWPLLLYSFLIIFGNTGFPVMLRWCIYVLSKLVPRGSGIWEELRFLLDHPRRCFTLLFPSRATWWLFGILFLLNGVDLLFFIILDFGNPIVTNLAPNIRVLDGFFQAAATRTAGFSVVSIPDLHPAVQISYMIMMYISVFPIAISVRRTNVYEEQSLGIWTGVDDPDDNEKGTSYVGSHIRRQLSFDLWFVALGWFIIAIAEGKALQASDRPAFNLFSVLFEIISAYGTVGLSMGYPDTNQSFSAQFGVIGKLIIIAMQIRGRHRGLPYELDRAILLPSESLHQRELAEAEARRARRASTASQVGGMQDINKQKSRDSNRSSGGASTAVSTGGARNRQKSTGNLLSAILHPGPPAVRRSSTMKKYDDSASLHSRFEAAEFGMGSPSAREDTAGMDRIIETPSADDVFVPKKVKRAKSYIPVPVSRRASAIDREEENVGVENDAGEEEVSPKSKARRVGRGLKKVMSV